MISQTPWLERTFSFDFPLGQFPTMVERFRGTPARLEDIAKSVHPSILTMRNANAWSIQEHIGHLLDLSDLDERRFDEFLSGSGTLSAADMQNKKTYAANHNARNVGDILRAFRRTRMDLVAKLERLTADEVGRTAVHPRLKRELRLIDWIYFMAEHDDHHIARMTSLVRTLHPT